MMTEDECVDNVDDLLKNLKIPACPPDSKKWRKQAGAELCQAQGKLKLFWT